MYVMTPIQIKPAEMVTIVMITNFTFDVQEFVPNTSATFRVVLYSDQCPKKVETVKLEGEDYKLWGNDDAFLIDYIAKQLGLVIAPVTL